MYVALLTYIVVVVWWYFVWFNIYWKHYKYNYCSIHKDAIASYTNMQSILVILKGDDIT